MSLFRFLWLGWICISVIMGGSYAEKAERARRPNILFIITDDQFREQFGFLGGEALTPHIDSLAEEGLFSQLRSVQSFLHQYQWFSIL